MIKMKTMIKKILRTILYKNFRDNAYKIMLKKFNIYILSKKFIFFIKKNFNIAYINIKHFKIYCENQNEILI